MKAVAQDSDGDVTYWNDDTSLSFAVSRPQDLAPARRAVVEFLHRWAIPSTIVDDLELATSELVTNALVHPPVSDQPVEVRVQAGDDVVIEVANHGRADAIPPVEHWKVPAPAQVSGRGLGIVRRLCDEAVVTQHGAMTVVACRRRIPDGRSTT